MEARSPVIVEELQALQSLLAAFPVAMPFRVPNGYFSDFAESLRIRLLVEENEEIADPVFSFVFPKKEPFDVPKDYFAQFAQSLKERIEEADFEETLSRKNVFQTPEGYFENLPEAILAAVKSDVSEEETTLVGFSKEMPFAVPEGYFQSFAENLQSRLAATESPKVIPLRPRKTLPMQVMRWAAAAALIVGISTGIERAGTPQATSETAQRALASVPENDLQNYVYQNADDFDPDLIESQLPRASFEETSPVQNLNTQEIQSFLSDDALL